MKSSRFMLAGTNSNVGKTTVTMGIMRALKNRGLKVQGFKSGPDYIDPEFHSFVTGNKSRNLDCWMVDSEKIRYLYNKNAKGSDVSIVEGVMGLYDGYSNKKTEGSSACLSKIIKSPVVLIIDGSGISTSAAAMVLGFKMYDQDVDLQGIIINKVHGERHYNLLKDAIERDTDIKCYGYLNKNKDVALESRHLGLIPSFEVEELDKKIDFVASMVEETIDIEGLLKLAEMAPDLEDEKIDLPTFENDGKIKLGVAYDKAFNFYYKDNFDLLEELGCELVFFSPLDDETIPEDICGLYFGGGFPEVFPEKLSSNKRMLKSIKDAVEDGMPTYCECGGLMYMCNSITTLTGEKYPMVGIVNEDSIMTKTLKRFGYIEVETKNNLVAGDVPLEFRAHEFHRSTITEELNLEQSYLVHKNKDMDTYRTWNCGYKYKNLLGAYAHVHFYSNFEFVSGLMQAFVARNRG